jgi:Lyzozyme M1 (1,4-beta-N-acetylmuramidase)
MRKWVAHWDVSEPQYGGAYAVWQYSRTGNVPGITGAVDLDYSYRDYPNPAPQAADISLLSDSPASLTLQKGKTYEFKFTPNGISGTPSFSSGSSGVLKVVSRKLSGGCYYVKVQAVGTGSTALYSRAPGAPAARRCVVTVG